MKRKLQIKNIRGKNKIEYCIFTLLTTSRALTLLGFLANA